MAMLTVENLEASYGAIRALHGISIHVAEGEAVALLGVNGVGKSTTLKSIMGVLRPVKGTITFIGQEITNKSPESIVSAVSRWCLKVATSLGRSPWRRTSASAPT